MGAAAMRSSYITKAAKATAAAASRATIAGLAQPSALPRISANISAVSAPAIRAVPGQSARAAGRVAGFAQPGHPARERRHADGQVDEEDGPPAQCVGQHPAGQRPDGAGGAERGAEDAQRPGQGGAGELRAQQRRGGGEQHRAADSLQRAEQLQRQRGRGQRARQRPGGEDDQAGQEQPAPAQPVTQGGRRQQQHRQHQGVGGAHPLQVRQARLQIPLNRWQRHAHYGDIQQQHEHRRAHQHQRPPLPRRHPRDFSHLSHHPKRRPLS